MFDDNLYDLRCQFYEYYRQSEYVNAILIGEKLLVMYIMAGQTESIDYADDAFCLAYIYQLLRHYKKASQLYLKSVSLTKKLNGTCPELADRVTNLAICCTKLLRLDEAVGFHEEAYRIRRNTLGEDHPDTVDSLYNIGNAYYDLGDYKNAISFHKKALPKRVGIFYADSLNCLGYCYDNIHDYERAIIFLEEALPIIAEHEGENSLDYLANVFRLAQVCDKMKDMDRIYKYFSKTARLIKKNISEKHPFYIIAINHLANYYVSTGEIEKSINIRIRALNLLNKTIGKTHMYYADNLKDIAVALYSVENYKKGTRLYLEALKVKEVIVGIESYEYINDALQLCKLLLDIDDYNSILKVCRKLMASENLRFDMYDFYDVILAIINQSDDGDMKKKKKASRLLQTLSESYSITEN